MKVTLFGATGSLGRECLEQCLQAGHDVTVLVRWFSETFLKHRHTDKEHQLRLLDENTDVCWLGVRPLQMKSGLKKGHYRLGYNAFSGFSSISFADCAHAMVTMLDDDTWTGKVPIIQY
jgi:putative NADH-flavin reductase